MATATKPAKRGIPLRVADLGDRKSRSMAKDFQPAVARIAEQLGDPLEAMGVMLAAIQDELALSPKPAAGLAMALGRGVLAREQLKREEGGSFSAEEARLQLGGLSKEAVLKRYRKGRLLGWREARQNAVRFPVWQFADGNVLSGLTDVLETLNRIGWMDDWGRILFFLNPRASLGGKRPLDLLRNGEIKRVAGLAESLDD